MVRLQTTMGAEGIRWSSHVTRAVRSHMAARHSPLQQVSSSSASCFGFWLLWIHIDLVYIVVAQHAAERERGRESERERVGEIETERHWGSSEHTFNTRWLCVLMRNAICDQSRNIEHVFISFIKTHYTTSSCAILISSVILLKFHTVRYLIWNKSERKLRFAWITGICSCLV